ncbi:hypothetical protein Slin14017_G012600 [Septoria linicola]|nr:hypothetical protein Slin14017_G012600 [Septoria linicola]
MSSHIAPSPLFMGSYELSAEAKRSIRARIVLTELKSHVEPLLLRLPQFYASASAGSSGGTGAGKFEGTGTPLEVQRCVLREQLQQLLAEARQTT